MADESNPKDMGIRELLMEVRTDMKWVKDKLTAVCAEQKTLQDRVAALERLEAEQKGATVEKKDNTALIFALAALAISTISTLANLIGG